ncbi:MAG: TonB-dependent receptor [Bacteroidia bacterium]
MVACFTSVVAQQVTIKGKVLDINEETALEAVQVSSGAQGAFTDADGKFSFAVDRAPEIKVKFAYNGMDSTITVATEAGKSEYEIDMRFGKLKSIVIDPMIITDSRNVKKLSESTSSVDVIGQKKVDLQISSRIEDALVQNSGVDIIDGQPNIRGSSGYAYGVGSRVMVMLDGLPLLSPDAGFAQFDLIPVDNIAQVEVMKGASSVLYGSSALGGVINVLMADAPEKPKTSIRLRSGAYDAPHDKRLDWDSTKFAKNIGINVFHSRKIGTTDLTALVDLWHDTGWRYGTGSTQGRMQVMTKFRPKNIQGFTWGVNASAKFDSSTTFLFWNSYLPDDSVMAFGSSTPVHSYGALDGSNSARSQFNTRYTVDPFFKYLTPKGAVHHYHGRFMHTANINDTQQSNRNYMFYNDYTFTKRFLDNRLAWVIGGTASYNIVRGDSLYQGGHHALNTAAYTQFDWKIKSWLNATLGGRFDNWNIDDTINNSAPIFRAGLNAQLWKGASARTSFGQAFRSPSIAERYTNTFASGLTIAPNNSLLVEKGFSAEVGFRQNFLFQSKTRNNRSLLGYIDVAAFMMNYNNMIEFGVKPPDPDSFNPFDLKTVFWAKNYAHARTNGIEATMMLQWTHDKFRFDINGGITFIDPVNLNPGVDSLQADLLNTVGPQDNPFNFDAYGMLIGLFAPDSASFQRHDNPRVLKYRSKWLNRFSATVGYGPVSLTCNYRYKSQVLAIDQFLYVAIPGSADWVLSHNKGYGLVDFIVTGQVTKALQASLSVENAFNTEYVILPGIIGEQRNFNVQLKYVF